MKVLIVAKTHMHGMACVGGIEYDTGRGVRLLQSDGANQPADTPYNIGQIWEMDLRPGATTIPPHVEDMLVLRAKPLGHEPNVPRLLLQRIQPWRGTPSDSFDGLVRPTYQGSGYINAIMGIPSMSTGFWIPDRPLAKEINDGRLYYRYPRVEKVRLLRYVGFAEPINIIPAGTLVRLSLARWWKPQDSDIESRCYLQLSGWYL